MTIIVPFSLTCFVWLDLYDQGNFTNQGLSVLKRYNYTYLVFLPFWKLKGLIYIFESSYKKVNLLYRKSHYIRKWVILKSKFTFLNAGSRCRYYFYPFLNFVSFYFWKTTLFLSFSVLDWWLKFYLFSEISQMSMAFDSCREWSRRACTYGLWYDCVCASACVSSSPSDFVWYRLQFEF